jgi:hypothetical protein
MSVVGTMILRKVEDLLLVARLRVSGSPQYKSPLAIGGFIGLIFVVANLCLMLSAIFGNIANEMDDDDKDAPYEAFSVFQFFLFSVYVSQAVCFTIVCHQHARTAGVVWPDVNGIPE